MSDENEITSGHVPTPAPATAASASTPAVQEEQDAVDFLSAAPEDAKVTEEKVEAITAASAEADATMEPTTIDEPAEPAPSETIPDNIEPSTEIAAETTATTDPTPTTEALEASEELAAPVEAQVEPSIPAEVPAEAITTGTPSATEEAPTEVAAPEPQVEESVPASAETIEDQSEPVVEVPAAEVTTTTQDTQEAEEATPEVLVPEDAAPAQTLEQPVAPAPVVWDETEADADFLVDETTAQHDEPETAAPTSAQTEEAVPANTFWDETEAESDFLVDVKKPEETAATTTPAAEAAATSTFWDENEGDSEFLADVATVKTEEAAPAKKDEDLAALWEAALDDDDLLTSDNEAEQASGPWGAEDHEEASLFDSLKQDNSQEPQLQQASTANPWANDGDDSFLDQLQAPNTTQPAANQQQKPYTNGVNASANSNRATANPYAPHQPSSSDLVAGIPNIAHYGGAAPSPSPYGSQFAPQRPAPPQKTESFVDAAKEGYKSPYDLPVDLTRTRRQPAQRSTTQPLPVALPPPPRSSSMTTMGPPKSTTPAAYAPSNNASAPHLASPAPMAPPSLPGAASEAPRPALRPQASTSSFFEELPTAPRSKKYAPQTPVNSTFPPMSPFGQPTPGQIAPPPRAPSVPLAAAPPSNPYANVTPAAATPAVNPYANAGAIVPPPRAPSVSNHYAPQAASSPQFAAPPRMPSAQGQYAPSVAPARTQSPNMYASPPTLAAPSAPMMRPPSALSNYAAPPPAPAAVPVQAPPPPQQQQQAPPLQAQVGQSQEMHPDLIQQSQEYPTPDATPASQPDNYFSADQPVSVTETPAASVNEPSMESGMDSLRPKPPPGRRSVSPYMPRSPPTANKTNNYAPLVPSALSQSQISPPRDTPRGSATGAPSIQDPFPVSSFAGPKRSQTQSPGQMGPTPAVMPNFSNDPIPRPASVQTSTVTTARPYNPYAPNLAAAVTPERYSSQSPELVAPLQLSKSRDSSGPSLMSPIKTLNSYAPGGVQRNFSSASEPQLDFIPPTDEQQHDPLQRWRGAPIVRFGFGGVALTTFPKHIPRYASGQALPMIKSSPGEISIRQTKDILDAQDHMAKFPGPLKAKSKKKDVVTWLGERITAMQEGTWKVAQEKAQVDVARHEEKILLWKLVKVLVEHDGVLDGTPEVLKAINAELSPELQAETAAVDGQYSSVTDAAAISRPNGAPIPAEAVDPVSVDGLRKQLLRGEREKAVWDAVDHRLWAHAMLIASTLDKSVWRKVAQEFVRLEVKTIGENTESLSSLYQIFAGNFEESMDELVPPSARSGLQMVNRIGGIGPQKNALDGLNKWKETLTLVLNNRSAGDQQALVSLGQLLASYGRIEAAHICYIFARSPTLPPVFGGVDDPQAAIVLLGVDHRQNPTTFGFDEDAILLTEVFEFATSVLPAAAGSTGPLPHLQAFKLRHALLLAEVGQKNQAQQYCEMIEALLKSSTRRSPYYNPHLCASVEELGNRLKAAPGSSSWISKPSMEKVSGSMWAKFNSFVAGDDSDATSTGSKQEDIGPFAKVSGTPTISRSPSVADIYGSYSGATSMPNVGAANSRYAPSAQYSQPSGQYSARSSSEMQRGRPSLDSQRSAYVPNAYSMQSARRPSNEGYAPRHDAGSAYANSNYAPSFGAAASPSQNSYMPSASIEQTYSAMHQSSSQNSPPLDQAPSFGGYQPMSVPEAPIEEDVTPAQDSSSFGGYAPPSYDTGYVPYQPDDNEEDSPVETKSKKKSFMDDDEDEDFEAKAAALKKAEKERKDREADDAFRKAAEADGKFIKHFLEAQQRDRD